MSSRFEDATPEQLRALAEYMDGFEAGTLDMDDTHPRKTTYLGVLKAAREAIGL